MGRYLPPMEWSTACHMVSGVGARTCSGSPGAKNQVPAANLGFELARLPAGIAQVEPQPRHIALEHLGFGVLGIEVAAQIEAVENFSPPFD